jgi:tetratricopeptide (TPR) repeat protein
MEPQGQAGDGASPAEPHDAAGYVNRSLLRLAEGDYAGAVADCGEALKQDPENVDALLTRAKARQGQGYVDRALADCDRAAKMKPQDIRAYLVRGQIHTAEDQLDLARQDYDQALLVDPRSTEALTNRAQLRAAQGDSAGALIDCNDALDIDARNPEAYLTRAAARWEQGDLAGGIADCDEAIRLAPADAKAYLLRGNLRQTQDDDEGADADYGEALRLDPSIAGVLQSQGYEPEDGNVNLPAPAGDDHAGVPATIPFPAERALTPGMGGLRTWMVVGTVHGALAGLFFGIMSQTFAAALAMLLFAPLFVGLFLGRDLGVQRSGLIGFVVAVSSIAWYLVSSDDSGISLLWVTERDGLRITCWLLGWGVLGALFLMFAGCSNLVQILAVFQGGVGRAVQWAKAGVVVGVAVGAILAGIYWLDPAEAVAGGLVGAVAGLVLGGAAGAGPWALVPMLLLAILGTAAGAVGLEGWYRVLSGGLGGSLYWAVAGGVVGLFVGASVGSRAAPRIMGGPLHARLFKGKPLPLGKDLALAVGLLVGVGGLLMGASVGMVAGAIFGAIPALAGQFESTVAEGLVLWAAGGAVVGATLGILFNSRLVSRNEADFLVPADDLDPARRLVPVFIVLGGAVGGAVLGALVGGVPLEPGGIAYWALAGAVTGGTTATKLWSVTEK